MARMTAADAAVAILLREGVTHAFGVPGAAINPLYAALLRSGGIDHVLARHVEGAVAHGGGLHPHPGRQHRGLHRHLRAGRHRHDHRHVLRGGGLDPDPVHHRPGAGRPAAQGGLPGRRHRLDRQAADQDGGHRARARSGAGGVPAGVPPHALRPARPGADRPAVRRADDRDRVRPRHLHAAAGIPAGGKPGAGREGPGHAAGVHGTGHRGRRRDHQRRRRRPAGRAGRDCWASRSSPR